MKIPWIALSLMTLPGSWSAAAGLEQVKIDLVTPQVQEGLLQIKQASPRWTSVDMRLYATGSYYDLSDLGLRISMNGSRMSSGHFYFNGRAADKNLNLSAYPTGSDPRRGYNIYGGDVSLWLTPSGDGFSVNGSVGRRNVWFQVRPMGSGYSIWGQMGLNLSAYGSGTGLWMNGSADLSQFDEPSVAVLGAVLSIIHAMPPATK
jgi:hypothetical protein